MARNSPYPYFASLLARYCLPRGSVRARCASRHTLLLSYVMCDTCRSICSLIMLKPSSTALRKSSKLRPPCAGTRPVINARPRVVRWGRSGLCGGQGNGVRQVEPRPMSRPGECSFNMPRRVILDSAGSPLSSNHPSLMSLLSLICGINYILNISA